MQIYSASRASTRQSNSKTLRKEFHQKALEKAIEASQEFLVELFSKPDLNMHDLLAALRMRDMKDYLQYLSFSDLRLRTEQRSRRHICQLTKRDRGLLDAWLVNDVTRHPGSTAREIRQRLGMALDTGELPVLTKAARTNVTRWLTRLVHSGAIKLEDGRYQAAQQQKVAEIDQDILKILKRRKFASTDDLRVMLAREHGYQDAWLADKLFFILEDMHTAGLIKGRPRFNSWESY